MLFLKALPGQCCTIGIPIITPHFQIKKNPRPFKAEDSLTSQSPMQDVAPNAVRIAEAIDTTICAINLIVSFLLIASHF